MAQSTAFVTGANGFVAQTLVHQLLQKGYKVIGQVRSKDKGEHLTNIVSNPGFSYEVVPVIEVEGAFDEVLKKHPEVEAFFHTASPVSYANEDVEQNILLPAIDGTKFLLKSLEQHAPLLEHFVYTSSGVAQFTLENTELIVFEDSWSPITYEESKTNGLKAYIGSKKFAEQEVWKFSEEHKPKFTIATILPSVVLGPQAYEGNIKNLTSSASFFASAINSKSREELEAAIPFPYGIDVRDVARAHIFAAEDSRADGKRLSLSNGVFNADTILTILNEKYPGKTLLKPHNPPTPLALDLFNSESTQALIGKFLSLEKSIEDSLAQHVKVGDF